MNELPFILAGPILRRVEPGLVTVWVALKAPSQITLSVYACEDPSKPMMASAAGTVSASAEATSTTIRVLEHLHVGIVQARPLAPEIALKPDTLYAYNIRFDGNTDLDSLGLLTTSSDGKGPGHRALGYEDGRLPSFLLPPPRLDQLRILHGSCRRLNKSGVTDGLAWVDDFIRPDDDKPLPGRPHQLYLTGDQLYADDVAAAFLHHASTLGAKLMGTSTEQFQTEKFESRVQSWPADLSHFPVGLRKIVLVGSESDRLGQPTSKLKAGDAATVSRKSEAMFTTDDAANHLMSFSEYCAAYLLSWCNVLWPVDDAGNLNLATYDDVFPSYGADDDQSDAPRIWRVHLELSDKAGGATLRDVLHERFHGASEEAESRERGFESGSLALTEIHRTLPLVRRALANVPTYMIFDDHDVTDDWNLTKSWCDQVYASPLGRAIVRNALMSYAVFQGWGNDPERFEDASTPGRKLLDGISRAFPESHDGPDGTVAADIDELLGLGEANPSSGAVTWHYTVPGATHMTAVLDTRTRRTYRRSMAPPALIAGRALDEQLPIDIMSDGQEVLLVISPPPVFTPALIEQLAQPLAAKLHDMANFRSIRDIPGTSHDVEAWTGDAEACEALLRRLASFMSAVVLSGDIHFGYSARVTYWTKRKTDPPARIALLTSSGLANGWPESVQSTHRGYAAAARMFRHRSRVERFGWHTWDDATTKWPVELPRGHRVTPPTRALLRRRPVLLLNEGWPNGTKLAKPRTSGESEFEFDFAWRYEQLGDERPESERSEATQLHVIITRDDEGNFAGPGSYVKIATQHSGLAGSLANSRHVVFANNIGLVTFEVNRNTKGLGVVHAIYARILGRSNIDLGNLPIVMAQHRTRLSVNRDDIDGKPPMIGTWP